MLVLICLWLVNPSVSYSSNYSFSKKAKSKTVLVCKIRVVSSVCAHVSGEIRICQHFRVSRATKWQQCCQTVKFGAAHSKDFESLALPEFFGFGSQFYSPGENQFQDKVRQTMKHEKWKFYNHSNTRQRRKPLCESGTRWFLVYCPLETFLFWSESCLLQRNRNYTFLLGAFCFCFVLELGPSRCGAQVGSMH